MHACPAEFAILYMGKRCILCCALAESLFPLTSISSLEYLGILRVRLAGLLPAPLHE
jgi:hypothetical protein